MSTLYRSTQGAEGNKAISKRLSNARALIKAYKENDVDIETIKWLMNESIKQGQSVIQAKLILNMLEQEEILMTIKGEK